MTATDQVTQYMNSFDDWRGDLLKELRQLIDESAPEMSEDFKWSVPVWTHNGLVLAISAFKDHVKINFFKGVYLPDPQGIINAGLDSKEHRSIDFQQGDKINKPALTHLIRSASAYTKTK